MKRKFAPRGVATVLLMSSLCVGGMARGADSPEDLFWKSVKKSDVIEEYRLYVRQYPKGTYAGDAWRRIGQLEAEEKSALAARREADVLRPGKIFKDCADCPEMVSIPAGSFEMGSKNVVSKAGPMTRSVRIGNAFALGKTEVTQRQWRVVMGNNPSYFSNCGDDCPVEQVSWNDAQDFVRKLSQKTGKTYRLPSEAEWEYACRAGGVHTYCGDESIETVAWYEGNSGSRTHSTAGKQANAWGLHDMSGNVWEWTEDCWNIAYSGAPGDGSAWTSGDCTLRILRGGSWSSNPQYMRSANRGRNPSGYRGTNSGFRLARTLF